MRHNPPSGGDFLLRREQAGKLTTVFAERDAGSNSNCEPLALFEHGGGI